MKTTALLSLSAALSVLASSVSAAATARGNSATNTASVVVAAADTAGECRILNQESTLCPSIQYLTNIQSPLRAEMRIQEYFDALPKELNGLQAPCLQVLQEALCLVEFPKCKGQTQQVLPVCQSVRERVEKICSEPFQRVQTEGSTDDKGGNDEAMIMIARIQDQLFSPAALDPTRWAASPATQEPDCVSWDDHGLGSAPLENIRIINDLDNNEAEAEAEDGEDAKAEEIGQEMVRSTLETRHLSRRERGSMKYHHHHHHNAQKRDVISAEESAKENDKKVEADAIVAPLIAVRADTPSAQGTYAINKDEPKVSISNPASADKAKNVDDSKVLVHENLGHSESHAESPGQRVLIQGGSVSDDADPAKSVENLGKASEGHPVDKDAAKAEGEANSGGEEHTKKGTVLLAAVPILLVMGAIAGFTIYRRYYENSFNQGGRNDSRDDHPNDGYHQRDLPIRKGSPIHFDRTFLNTIHSPPPTATYLHDPDSPSRSHHHSHYNTQHSPQSIAAGNSLKRPTPSAGSIGKNRFQELSRSYDFSAGLRSIKNALTRSNNNSREGALNQAAASSSGSGSAGSLSGRNSGQYAGAFGAGGHSIAKIGSHPGLNALERQQLQAQFGSGVGGAGLSSSTGAAARFPDVNNMNATQEHSIVWGQYSANDEHDVYLDASSALASNLGAARKSGSTNSLSMLNSGGKYSHHHHRQRSSDRQRAGSPRDSIGDCLSPESPSMLTREELMRRHDLYSEGYAFASETASIGEDDTHSGTNLLFDARDHFFDLAGSGAEKIAAAAAAGVSAQMIDEEMDMYLEMEKEESPFVVDDYNSMNPSPYEPKVLTRQMIERRQSIQKTAAMREKEISEKSSEKAVVGAGNDEAAAKVTKSQSKKDRRKLAKQAKKQQLKQGSGGGKMEEEEVFDEKRAMEAQEAAVVTDTEAEPQTHVLGCDSPDWRE